MKFNKGDKVRIKEDKLFKISDLNRHSIQVDMRRNSIWEVVAVTDCKVMIMRDDTFITLFHKELELLIFTSTDPVWLALNKLITSHKYTRYEIAVECKINYYTLCDIINGRRNITECQANKITPLLIKEGLIKEEV